MPRKGQTKPSQRVKRKHRSPSPEDDRAPSTANESPEDLGDEIFTNMAKKMIDATKKRREARRKEHSNAFLEQMAQLKKEVDDAFVDKTREKKTRDQFEHLGRLLHQKAEIEGGILKKATELENAYLSANKELSVILMGRKRDIEDAFKAI